MHTANSSYSFPRSKETSSRHSRSFPNLALPPVAETDANLAKKRSGRNLDQKLVLLSDEDERQTHYDSDEGAYVFVFLVVSS